MFVTIAGLDDRPDDDATDRSGARRASRSTRYGRTVPPVPDTVLVAGAGDLGLALAGRLAAAGALVTTLNRSGRAIEGANRFVGDLTDPTSLRGLPSFSVVVLTTAPPGRDDAAYRTAYVDGPAHLLDALPSDPGRVVLTSTTGVYGVDDGSWVDETSPTEPTRSTAEIVLEGERQLAALAPTVVLRPAGIYGPGRTRLIESVRAGDVSVAADGTPRWTNRVHRDDVVSALLTLTTHSDPPPVAIAVDDEPSPRDDVVRWLATRLGAPEPPTTVVTRSSGKRCHNTRLRSLGWSPAYPTFRDGYAELLASN